MRVFQFPLLGCSQPLHWHYNYPISTFPSVTVQNTPPHRLSSPKRGRGYRLQVLSVIKEMLWESTGKDHHLSTAVQLLVPTISPHSNKEVGSQTEEALSCSPGWGSCKQLPKPRLSLSRSCFLSGKSWPESQRSVGQNDRGTREPVGMDAQKQEDQQARMTEQVDITFREVLYQMGQVNLVRVPPWFLSIATKPRVDLICPVMQQRVDASVADTTPEIKGSQAPTSTSSPDYWANTLPPPVLPMSGIPTASTPVGQPFLALKLLPSTGGGTTLQQHTWQSIWQEGPHWDWWCQHQQGMQHSAYPVQNREQQTALATSHSFDLLEPKLIDLPFSPVKDTTDPNDGVAEEASRSTGDCGRDSTLGVSESNTDQSGNESDSDSKSQETAINFDSESGTGDCLTCSDTEEAAFKSAYQKFHKKAWASWRLIRQGLWKVAQLAQIKESHQTVWGATTVWSKQSGNLLSRKTIALLKWTRWQSRPTNCSKSRRPLTQNICHWEHEADVHRKKKTLVQLLGQFQPTSTSCTKRAWPMPWLACRDFIWVMSLSSQTFLPLWGQSLSAFGVLS